MTTEKLLTAEEIATILSIDKQTVLRYLREDKMKHLKIGNQYRVKESDFNAFIETSSLK